MTKPKAKQKADDSTGSLFEENYLVRTLGRIAQDPEVALTELVANAWDAGASLVDLTIPPTNELALTVEDDGHGMNAGQFKGRWMKLGYNRLKHQSALVEFPPERQGWRRKAYGRNGVGRHGLLCFADQYSVETWREDKGASFDIGTQSEENPFKIEKEGSFLRKGHGTKLSVIVQRHLPDADAIREILAGRFVHDPQFVVRVNGVSVALAEQIGLIEKQDLQIPGCPPAEAFVVDTTRTAKYTLYQGIAFWVNGRLVGVPSWVVGSEAVIDGRARFAKRFSIVIKADDGWLPEVEQDWVRFKSGKKVDALFEAARDYAKKVFAQLSATLVEESSEEALVKNREDFKELSPLGRAEVASFARDLVKATPTVSQDVLSAAVQAVINLEKARGGAALLEKLTKLDESDIDGLDRLLSQWTVRDALSVLDEIDQRLAVIVAIEKLSGDDSTDELHTLHPLVTQARWLFGPEFDSSEYASNVSLKTAAEKVFQKRLSKDAFVNAKQRPDIMALANATCSIVGTEGFDPTDPTLTRIQNVLIIELKKGRSAIGRDEMNQADGYVQDFLESGALDGTPMFRAFVVGYEIAPKTVREKDLMEEKVLRGRVQAVTYGQLTRSAHQRLFRLKERIPARYEDVSGADLSAKVMQIASQTTLGLEMPAKR
ncbi:ATP-binding protein [Zoogloea sp.]|uniref:ATP-binding protein n=1 Tax=Zoogloea sp. TaxID=49181 RepID=UPI0025DF7418|nr:ATP-binding protein [Zoogloea sp.]MCK6393072.1 ATP-binding protein [Zoogloea sp.]MCK6408468.1 ATP-binding protein [Thauera sp.]